MKHSDANDAAFPRPCGHIDDEQRNLEQDGLTVREYFAALAVQGLLAGRQPGLTIDVPELAQAAFDVADALVAQSKKG